MFSPKPIAVALVSIFITMTASAKELEKVCAGNLTDMRVIGVQLGNCDLNSLSDDDFKRVTDVCGEPHTVGDDNEVRCWVRAMVSSTKTAPVANHGYGARVFVVHKILKVEKR
jgi:hypothetical protein